MKTLFALVVGLVLALVMFLLSPLLQELTHRARQRLYLAHPRLLARAMQAAMAVPADVGVRGTAMPYSDVNVLVTQHNNLVTAIRGIAAKMDLDAGITDANYTALWLDSAIATAPQKIIPQ